MNVLVTGAAGAMGAAIAEEFVARQNGVAITDISGRRLGDIEQQLTGRGVQVHSFRADVTEESEAAELVSSCLEALGSIDVLINVVGGYRGTMYEPVTEISIERFDDAMRRNLRGTFLLTRLVAPQMVRNGYGRIVNIASVAGYGVTGQADYSAAKAGVMAFTKSCALEFAPAVTVNAIAPGVIRTSVLERMPQDVQDRYLERIPMGRFGLPKDVARCAAFLASEDAEYLTGEVLNVSGGFLGWL